ncbi:MAG: response regulator [Gammaproteobacteria bacterium]|nr:response regulator [Gammaproteobacteria bacterium]
MANQYTAMVVNNNAMERNSIIGVLKRDFNLRNIISAQSNKEALNSLRVEDRVDWIFFDQQLPDGDGFVFIGEAKKIAKTERSAFILTASTSDKATLLRAAAAGVNEFVLKPFTPSTLVSKVRHVLESADRRTAERLAPVKDHLTMLNFGAVSYKGKLIDISLGGCMVRSQIFDQGGMIYDKGILCLPLDIANEPANVEVEVVRLERNPDYDNSRDTMRVGLKFTKMSDPDLIRLKNFITRLKQGK